MNNRTMTSEYKEFTGKVAVVTGASSGIGASVAVALSRLGARVVLVARNEQKLRAVAAQCPAQTKVVIADLAKDEDVTRTVREAVAAFDHIDVLVNNAGYSSPCAFDDPSAISEFKSIMNVNLRAAVRLTYAALPYLIETKGNVVNVSSVMSMKTTRFFWHYGTSKAALDYFTRSVADELAPAGVRVNCVNPGPVRTDIIKNIGVDESMEEKVYNGMKRSTVLKRVSEPEEIADVIVFLASDIARGVTGSCWVSDNGVLCMSHI